MKHVVVIDDDPSIRRLLKDYLSLHAFRVTDLSGTGELHRVLASDTVDLMIVDLNLGKEDGMDIVRKLSSTSDVPIIIISGNRLEEADKVIGLELGAVDYITKPFGVRELLARARSCVRERPSPTRKKERRTYTFGDWALNLRLRKLTFNQTLEVKLTAGEFNLLTALLKTPRQILSREQLISASRVRDEEVFDRSIDVLILRLRRKLEADPARPKLIKTERGAGYFFDAEVQVA